MQHFKQSPTRQLKLKIIISLALWILVRQEEFWTLMHLPCNFLFIFYTFMYIYLLNENVLSRMQSSVAHYLMFLSAVAVLSANQAWRDHQGPGPNHITPIITHLDSPAKTPFCSWILILLSLHDECQIVFPISGSVGETAWRICKYSLPSTLHYITCLNSVESICWHHRLCFVSQDLWKPWMEQELLSDESKPVPQVCTIVSFVI